MYQEFPGFFPQMISELVIWELDILGNSCLFLSFPPSNNLLYFATESK